jgi:L-asparaginase
MSSTMASLLIITTGGTFDKEYGRGAGVRNLTFGSESAVTDIFRRALVPKDWLDLKLLAKDSLDMDDQDRAKILDLCTTTPCTAIVITHGTDTMVATAAFIARAKLAKTIVLTGAAQPARMKDSDADFNLGFAAAAAQCKPPGVYVVMNGRAFDWDHCRKNSETGVFEAI